MTESCRIDSGDKDFKEQELEGTQDASNTHLFRTPAGQTAAPALQTSHSFGMEPTSEVIRADYSGIRRACEWTVERLRV